MTGPIIAKQMSRVLEILSDKMLRTKKRINSLAGKDHGRALSELRKQKIIGVHRSGKKTYWGLV